MIGAIRRICYICRKVTTNKAGIVFGCFAKSNFEHLRDGAEAARRFDLAKAGGSNPSPATRFNPIFDTL